MHELSIARAIVEEVSASADEHDIDQVVVVTMRIGRLAGIVEDSLRFGLEIAGEGTKLEGAELVVERTPVVVWCPVGDHSLELDGLEFRCKTHDALCPDLLSGRELEIASYSQSRSVESEPDSASQVPTVKA